MKDHQFDDLVGTAQREKDKSEKEFFDKLLTQAVEQPDGSTSAPQDHRLHFSPVEMVLKKHLKESLAAHERYYQELKQDFQRRRDLIQADYRNLVDDLYTRNLSDTEISDRIVQLQQQSKEQRETLETDVERCCQMVASAYDRYLSEHIPSLSILPVTITLSILNKSIQIPDIQLRPETSLCEIKDIMKAEMEKRGDKVTDFAADVKFLCFGPFARRSLYEMHQMAKDVLEHNASHTDIVVLPERCRPVLQYNIKHGSEIAVYGLVRCESDMPKRCFAETFIVGSRQVVDYFSCRECSFNWICRACMEGCHKDHDVAPYIMGHQPTWACCYCPKKKKCVIQQEKAG